MLAVRVDDGTMIFAFGTHSVVTRKPSGGPDAFWQHAAEAAVAEHSGDLHRALVTLPGAKLIHEGRVSVRPDVMTSAKPRF